MSDKSQSTIEEADIGIEDENFVDNLINTAVLEAYNRPLKSKATVEKVPEIDLERSTEEEDDDVEIDIPTEVAPEPNFQTSKGHIQGVPSNIQGSMPTIMVNPAFSSSTLKPTDLDDKFLATNYPIFEYDIDKSEKPWKKPGSDLADYFNYGFNEETWKIYCEKQRRLRIETASMRRNLGDGQPNVEPPPTDISALPKSIEDLLLGQSPAVPNQHLLQSNMPIGMPPGLNLNLPPELANSIATLAASSIGLPPAFLAQLPSMHNLLPPSFMAQHMFQQNVGAFQQPLPIQPQIPPSVNNSESIPPPPPPPAPTNDIPANVDSNRPKPPSRSSSTERTTSKRRSERKSPRLSRRFRVRKEIEKERVRDDHPYRRKASRIREKTSYRDRKRR